MPIVLDEIECTDSKLDECRSFKLGGGNCRHEEDAYLECTDDSLEDIVTDVQDNDIGEGECIKDSRFNRVLRNEFVRNYHDMSVTFCRNFCDQYQRKYSGVEFGSECWCGDKPFYIAKVKRDECNYECPGKSNQQCGAANRMNIYLTESPSE